MKTKDKERARLALAELEKEMEILTKEQMNACKGGGDGTQSNPYTKEEYYQLFESGNFMGGYVQGWGYVPLLEGVAVFNEDKSKSIYNEYKTFSGFISTSNSLKDHLARFLIDFTPLGYGLGFMENNLNAVQRDMIGDLVSKGYDINSSLYISGTQDGSGNIIHRVYDGATGELITEKRTNGIGYYKQGSGNN